MCLLVKQPASTVFTDDFLEDVFTKNSDGLGVMYAEDGKLHVYKALPANAKDFIEFYRKHIEGKDCVWHARMQTHGDIDFDNCHPYKVTDDIWLAHNGVLSTGNSNDKSRSDTWHFIRNFIAPALTANPDLLVDQDWQDFVGDMIGRSNKFGLVRADGTIVIINEQAGVEFVGAWLSNTYAWSTYKFGFRSTYQNQGGYSDMYGSGYGQAWYKGYQFENEAEYEEPYSTTTGSGFGKVGKSYEVKGEYIKANITAAQMKPMVKAMFNCYQRRGLAGIEQWVYDAPHKAAALLTYWYDEIDDIGALVEQDPIEAAEWIYDLIRSDSIQPSLLS